MNEANFRKNYRYQRVILALGVLLMGMKFVAWWLTNSNAILTDALESIINVVAGAFALFSLLVAARPKDLNHPYGHGKIEFISAGFEGGLIFLAGFTIIAKSGYNLFFPQPLRQLDLGMLLVALPGLINFIMGWVLERQGRRSRSLILEASGKHLMSDAYSSAGLVTGLALLYLTGLAWLDNLIAILFGLIILYTGYRLMRTSVAGIMDEADYQLINRLVESLGRSRRPEWIDVHNFRVIKYGATLHIDCHLTVPYYYDVRQSHGQIKEFERRVADFCDGPVEMFIHTDPCRPPRACTICRKTDCPVRETPADRDIDWTLENVMKNQQHY